MKGCKFHQNKKVTETDTSNILESLKNAGANYTLLNAYKEPKNPLTDRELHFHMQSFLKGNYEERAAKRSHGIKSLMVY